MTLGTQAPVWLRGRRVSQDPDKACGAALSDAVIVILNDAGVRRYLGEPA